MCDRCKKLKDQAVEVQKRQDSAKNIICDLLGHQREESELNDPIQLACLDAMVTACQIENVISHVAHNRPDHSILGKNPPPPHDGHHLMLEDALNHVDELHGYLGVLKDKITERYTKQGCYETATPKSDDQYPTYKDPDTCGHDH